MARSKKKTKARPPTRSASTKKKASATKAKPKPRAKAAASATGAQSQGVEARWREYWECRTALESAVAAVRAAQTQLAEARSEEKERRRVFDQTKNALRDLLEVEPASSSSPPAAETRNLFDPGKRLGVVDVPEGDDDSEDEVDSEVDSEADEG